MTPEPIALLPLICAVLAARMSLLAAGRSRTLMVTAAGLAGVNLLNAAANCLPDTHIVTVLGRVGLVMALASCAGGVVFLVGLARLRRRRAWLVVATALTGAAAALALLDPEVIASARLVPWGGAYPLAGARLGLPFAVFGLLPVAALMATLVAWRRMPPSRRRRQVGLALVALAIADLGTVDVLPLTGAEIPPLGWAPTILALAILYSAITRVQLVDARTALAGTRFWAALIVAIGLPLFAVRAATSGWSGWSAPEGQGLALVALGLLALPVARALDRLLGRRRRFLDETARAFAAATSAPADRDAVAEPLAAALRAGAGLELASVDPAPAALPPAPVARAEIEADDALLAALDATRADVLVPLRHRGEPVAAVLCRAASPDLVLDEDTRAFLAGLGARAAVAYTNAALHGELSLRAQDLEREVVERTRSLEQAVGGLRVAQARLVQAERQSALGLLVAGVSHEVNNALNFIYANAPVLGRYAATYQELFARAGLADAEADAAAARLAAAAGEIGAATDRARALIEDLRRFARPDDATRKRGDLREGLRATLQLLSPTLRGRVAVTQRITPAAEGAYIVEGYPAALNHALLAVLLNAAEAIEGCGAITIDLAPAPAGGVRLVVSDDGRGVVGVELPRVFEPFFTTKTGTAGLGLTLGRQAVERHGGTLAIAANPTGRGTEVTIQLPAVAP